MAIEGVLTRQKCAENDAHFLGPGAAGSGRTEFRNLIFRILGILGKSLHHQMVLGPPNRSSDFSQKLGASGLAAFGGNVFQKMTPGNLFWGSTFKMYFRRRPPDRKPLVFEETSRTNLEVQRPFGNEGTF